MNSFLLQSEVRARLKETLRKGGGVHARHQCSEERVRSKLLMFINCIIHTLLNGKECK